MAGSPRETIDRLRVHVDELMARHTALIERCECLEVRLQEREKSIAALQKELENIHAKYRSLAMAQAVALHESIRLVGAGNRQMHLSLERIE